MPIYEYKCKKCGDVFEAIQKFSDLELKKCQCGKNGSVTKLISAAAFHLKGTGWYVTDFRDKGKKPGAKTDGAGDSKSESASGDSSASSASDSKPSATEAKSDAKSETRSDTRSETKPETKPETKSGTKTGAGSSKPAAAD